MKRWAIIREDTFSEETVLAKKLYKTKEEAEEKIGCWLSPLGVVEVEIPSKVRPFKVGDVTKDKSGHPVRIICTDRVSEDGRPIVALRKHHGEESMVLYYSDGRASSHTSYYVDLEPMYEDD